MEQITKFFANYSQGCSLVKQAFFNTFEVVAIGTCYGKCLAILFTLPTEHCDDLYIQIRRTRSKLEYESL